MYIVHDSIENISNANFIKTIIMDFNLLNFFFEHFYYFIDHNILVQDLYK